MKVHLSLATSDLEASVAFYAALLDREPAKVLHDYALFGICVTSPEDVERAIIRLNARGLAKSIERNQTCCYARQTKVWTADPEGRRWEVYAVLEETPARNDTAEGCCAEPCGCAA